MASIQFTEGEHRPGLQFNRKQLLPNLIDGLAQVRPNATWAKVPMDPKSWDHGHRKITYQLFANAINASALWLLRNLGAPQRKCQTVAYFGLWDPRYAILTVAAVKAGYKMVFPSGARGTRGIVSLLKQLDCEAILVATRDSPVIHELEAESGYAIHDAPPLADLLREDVAHISYTKTFAEAKDDPILVLHTSGSTGEPKPLVYTNDWASTWMIQNQALPPVGFRSLENMLGGIEMLSFTPQSHPGGFYSNLLGAVCNNIICIYPLPASALSLESLLETLRHNPVDLLLPPSFLLDQIAQSAERTSFLATHAPTVSFGGGPLGERTGNVLSKHVKLFSMYGTGENGTVSKMLPAGQYHPEWWNFVVPHPNAGFEMRPVSDVQDGAYSFFECVVVRNRDPELEQPVFKMKPELKEWSTKDVFKGIDAPEYGPNFRFYSYAYRLDDTLQLVVDDSIGSVTAKTLVPLEFEQQLSGTELIGGAIVLGHRRRYPGLLIELASADKRGNANTMDLVMEQVQACSRLLGESIDKKHVILADVNKPLPRAPKGTIQRAGALRLYQEEIDDMYVKFA